jgi:hypothetical protein
VVVETQSRVLAVLAVAVMAESTFQIAQLQDYPIQAEVVVVDEAVLVVEKVAVQVL